MTFIKHESFPDGIANLIRHFEFQERGESHIKFPQELYGEDVTPTEWMNCIGRQARAHRPTILTMDSGIKGNAISEKEMRQSGCSFVILLKAWAREPVQPFAWRILKVWPEIVEAADSASAAARQCRIDVPLKGRIVVTNL